MRGGSTDARADVGVVCGRGGGVPAPSSAKSSAALREGRVRLHIESLSTPAGDTRAYTTYCTPASKPRPHVADDAGLYTSTLGPSSPLNTRLTSKAKRTLLPSRWTPNVRPSNTAVASAAAARGAGGGMQLQARAHVSHETHSSTPASSAGRYGDGVGNALRVRRCLAFSRRMGLTAATLAARSPPR